MALIETLEKLSNAHGVAGREEEIRSLMQKFLEPYADEVREDRLGNVLAVVRGKKNGPKIMLAAHMDEIGLMVKTISKDGFLQFVKLGGIDDRVLLAQKVLVCTEKDLLDGIIGSRPPHIQKEDERRKVLSSDELSIDIGARSQDEAKKMGVRIGDTVEFDVKFVKAGKHIVMGKAFDDRVGCAAMVEVMKQLGKTDCTVCAVGTVQEEVGCRGAMTSAFGVSPDMGIALDVTIAGDTPGVKETEAPLRLGGGPALGVADSGLITPPKVLRLLVEAAEESRVPFQLEADMGGTTDASRISLSKEGVPAGAVSVPTRYIHSPTSLVSLTDIENTVKLTGTAIKKALKYL